jgi:hypothetical protein
MHFTHAVRQAGAFFSVTVQMNPHAEAAIAAIPHHAWTPIRYPRAIWDDQASRWVSDAEIAEVPYTALAAKAKGAVSARPTPSTAATGRSSYWPPSPACAGPN